MKLLLLFISLVCMNLVADCDLPKGMPNQETTFFLFSSEHRLYPLLRFNKSHFDNGGYDEFTKIKTVTRLLGNQVFPVRLQPMPPTNDKNPCNWEINYLGSDTPSGSLFFAGPKASIQTEISPEEKNRFLDLNKLCISDKKRPSAPCKKPILVATSDLDNNHRLEYWAILPHEPPSFVIFEVNAKGDALKVVSKPDMTENY